MTYDELCDHYLDLEEEYSVYFYNRKHNLWIREDNPLLLSTNYKELPYLIYQSNPYEKIFVNRFYGGVWQFVIMDLKTHNDKGQIFTFLDTRFLHTVKLNETELAAVKLNELMDHV